MSPSWPLGRRLRPVRFPNRQRLAAGQIVRGLRRVYMVSQKEREDRQLTSLRKNLGQLVLHLLKRDPKMRDWYRKIKQRRGSKIARVAVMRRITTIFRHMLTYKEPYTIGGPPPRLREQQAAHAAAHVAA